ncbi:MAG: xylulokinase [Pseudomonadota bacterium]|nr:xylulokinase [Pseudomonadota bacterium]
MFLGIDIGTSAVKAVIMGEDGGIVEASAPLTVQRPEPLCSEQDPDAWWSAANKAVLALPTETRKKVHAIGLAGQMHGATLLDASDRPLRPAILWNDGRSEAECTELEAAEPRSREITANMAFAGFTAPKLLWVAKHEPEVFAKIASVLLPKDYVRLQMTGDKATDVSDASGTLWLDVAKRRWSSEMLAATGLDEGHMPRLYEGVEVTGVLRADVARSWGMDQVPVAAGGGDNAAAAVGAGVIANGDAFISLGTSGVSFVATDSLRSDADRGLHAFCHSIPGRWHQMAVMLSAAASLDWAANLLCMDVVELCESARMADARATPIFLPYLSGERTPHADPHAKGVFFGMTADTGPEELARSVLDGVAMGLRDGFDVIRASGSSVESFTVVGGGSRSPYWGRLIAAALDRPLVYREAGAVGPALGAARLAQVAIGAGTLQGSCAPPPAIDTVEPERDLTAYYAELQPRFRALYTALQRNFRD